VSAKRPSAAPRSCAAQREAEERARREAEAQARQAEEAERQAELAARRRAEEQARREAEEIARRERELEAALAAELAADMASERQAEQAEQQRRASAAEQARQAAARKQIASRWVPLIQSRIRSFWVRPAGSPGGIETLVNLRLEPGGFGDPRQRQGGAEQRPRRLRSVRDLRRLQGLAAAGAGRRRVR
jgi:colicin import membrane protein